MVEATRLTRKGRLAEATALIQQHLGGSGGQRGRQTAGLRCGRPWRRPRPGHVAGTRPAAPARERRLPRRPRPACRPRALRRAASARPCPAERAPAAEAAGRFADLVHQRGRHARVQAIRPHRLHGAARAADRHAARRYASAGDFAGAPHERAGRARPLIVVYPEQAASPTP